MRVHDYISLVLLANLLKLIMSRICLRNKTRV